MHKFLAYLELAKLNFKPEILIVGTFNPAKTGNKADWFYGRKHNYFWDVLPALFAESGLRFHPLDRKKDFCSRKKIALTDLLMTIDDVNCDDLENYTDDLLAHLIMRSGGSKRAEWTNIAGKDGILKRYPSIKKIYLTRKTFIGKSGKIWKEQWDTIVKYCEDFNNQYPSEPMCAKALHTPAGYNGFKKIYQDWKANW